MQELDSYVAVGDSFTEGLDDPAPHGGYLGWADRLAAMISSRQRGFRYANLAIRGRLLQAIVEEQVPVAVALKPSLVTFCAGGNDLLMPGADPDAVAEVYEIAVAELRATGAEVVIFTGFDPRHAPVLRSLRGKVAIYNSHLWSVAERYNCKVVDLWSMTVLHDIRAWGPDRLHLAPEGHQRVALRVAELLGHEQEEQWRTPWPVVAEDDWMTQRRQDLKWAREHVVPFITRHLRGASLGDGVVPKRPELLPISSGENN
ncbi:SGNH/GDSL hydrolase family protein [Actinosynnema pretiosum subsp. pretiosum]|uniref:Lipolytic protein G-D-S-L family n=2 Tax=Actinosynnema TaxID=40566 RepID=C6WGN7_ACTMD|nr:SGNH/GDSL hydrolase family protein [Actinosynnema mirum]ACU34353.1 lipolytic protein G-D-S-L family [Actinosynnema mirum DSM 43827]AXX27727.1 hypothetical protein APASM_0362 [Actinosynnema pretiosum subsp. pretiosum]QUF01574.1 SGNH/GDSL hydrolase family protein [Actinosynnema pretiosum subsp. pretiosum]